MEEQNEIISSGKAAEILDITPQAVRALCRREKIEARKIGRDWMIDKDSVLAYLERNRDKSKFDPTR